MTEKEKMQAGMLYYVFDEQLVRDREDAKMKIYEYNLTRPNELDKRKEILKTLLGDMGEQIHVEPSFRCDYGYNIHIGENFYANFDCVMLDVCSIEIGDSRKIVQGLYKLPDGQGYYVGTYDMQTLKRLRDSGYGVNMLYDFNPAKNYVSGFNDFASVLYDDEIVFSGKTFEKDW